MTDLPDSLLRYRHQLERAVTADLGRRRRRTRLGAVALVLGLIVVVVNVIPSGGTDRRLPAVAPASAVERAAAALASDRETILHVHMIGRQYDKTRPDITWENESWVGAGGYRMVETPPDGPVAETEQAKGFDRIWDGERVLEAPAQDAEMSTSPEDKFRGEALQYLRDGKARVTGQVRRDGRAGAEDRRRRRQPDVHRRRPRLHADRVPHARHRRRDRPALRHVRAAAGQRHHAQAREHLRPARRRPRGPRRRRVPGRGHAAVPARLDLGNSSSTQSGPSSRRR